MGFNYGSEKNKFDREWAKKEKWYRECGMEETAILQMYEFDYQEFKRNRTICKREQAMYEIDSEEENEEINIFALKGMFIESIAVYDEYHIVEERFAWIEEIENDDLRAMLIALGQEDKEMLTMLVGGYSKVEIAELMGVARKKVTRHIMQIADMIRSITGASVH